MIVTERSIAIGQRIKEKREEAGITQANLSRILGGTSGLVWNYEKGKSMPNAERFEKMAEVLGTTVLYLQTGVNDISPDEETVDESEKEPVNVKKFMTNSEGYMDPTASKAIAIVMNKPQVKVGEVYSYNDSSQIVVVLKNLDKRVLVAPLDSKTPKNNTAFSVCCLKNKDDTYYVDLNYICSRDIQTIANKATKKFVASEISLNVLTSKLQKILGFNFPETKKESKPEPDNISMIFADSVKYFNEKNNTEFTIPEGVVSLKEAIDISKGMNITFSEFIKDHTEDRILDEICRHEEEIKRLKAKIGLE